MMESSKPAIRIDLNDFKLHLQLKNKTQLTLHFNSPSRRFYLSVIALVVNEMKKLGKIKSIPLQEHLELLALLNESVGGAAGSSDKGNLLPRIYAKWKNVLPNLEEAPLFKVLGRKKVEGDGAIGKIYSFTDVEKDGWANLFDYMGSEKNVRLKFAIDQIGVGLNETSIIFGDSRNGEAWEQFISNLKSGTVEVASINRMKYPLPDRPSIAVLPFVNMSEDPKQEFLCDGMTEELITALSKVPNLFVISRQSTSFFKGKPVRFNRVSEELGVRYVLEGSLQRSGDRVRITAQLIDALTGYHLWAERYNRDLQDIFALQDEMTLKILTAVRVKLTYGGDVSRAEKFAEKYYRGKEGLDCYLKLMEAMSYHQRTNIENNNLARRMIEDAIAMCPENPMGYLDLGWVYHADYWMGNTKSPRETLEQGIELAQKVIAMDDSIADAHALLCALYLTKREYEKASAEGERAMALNPGSPAVLHINGNLLTFTRRPEEAIPLFRKAIRLNPFGPSYLYRDFGMALVDCCRLVPQSILNTGRFEEAVSALKKAIQIAPDDIYAHMLLANTYTIMGREKEARAEGAEVLRINPKFSVEKHIKTSPMLWKDQSEIDEVINIFRKAGLK
jgi:TolB-like protein/Flp pilus assembly protein TadD